MLVRLREQTSSTSCVSGEQIRPPNLRSSRKQGALPIVGWMSVLNATKQSAAIKVLREIFIGCEHFLMILESQSVLCATTTGSEAWSYYNQVRSLGNL